MADDMAKHPTPRDESRPPPNSSHVPLGQRGRVQVGSCLARWGTSAVAATGLTAGLEKAINGLGIRSPRAATLDRAIGAGLAVLKTGAAGVIAAAGGGAGGRRGRSTSRGRPRLGHPGAVQAAARGRPTTTSSRSSTGSPSSTTSSAPHSPPGGPGKKDPQLDYLQGIAQGIGTINAAGDNTVVGLLKQIKDKPPGAGFAV